MFRFIAIGGLLVLLLVVCYPSLLDAAKATAAWVRGLRKGPSDPSQVPPRAPPGPSGSPGGTDDRD